jgi:ubiquinone/menaquinone biosynthesis C-methylase UbiE
MTSAATPIAAESFAKLHPRAIESRAEIRAALSELARAREPLQRGTNRSAEPELATIETVGASSLRLRTAGFPRELDGPIFLNSHLRERPIFFSAPLLGRGSDWIEIAIPQLIYEAERRDRARREPSASERGGLFVCAVDGAPLRAELADLAPDGIGLRMSAEVAPSPGQWIRVATEPSVDRDAARLAEVRSVRADARPGWTRIGLRVRPGERGDRVRVERLAQPARRPGAVAVLAPEPASVEFASRSGEPIRALVDRTGDPRGAPAVVIPSAWGKTKETLLPLAATLLATFAAAGRGLTVLRIDGVRRRGESYNDPDCAEPGRENLHYRFSQGVDDLLGAIAYLDRDPARRPSGVVFVSFSVSSVEARRAVVLAPPERVLGWISVVGATDPQSLMRVISGGVDYMGGAERGIRFGLQDVQGLLVDMDAAAADALAHEIAFLADARRDFARIRVPVTWFQGRDDAWSDRERVVDALSCGDLSKRRIVEVPTGHQLKSSAEAAQVFEAVACETARIALGVSVPSATPAAERVRARRHAERRRLPDPAVNLQRFWTDYLVGRDRTLGMQLATATSSHRGLMADQLQALAPRAGARLLDLGSGVGALRDALAEQPELPPGLALIELDYVREALARTRARHAQRRSALAAAESVVANLELGSGRGLPLADASVDAALISLVLNYLAQPAALLRDVRRVLRPGGRLVLSALRPDADTSQICVQSVAELRSGRSLAAFGAGGDLAAERALGSFINDAARLLDFEERGLFQFWDRGALAEMVEAAGFELLDLRPSFGEPPQAWLATARRGD